MIEISSLSFSYSKGLPLVLDHLSLTIQKGEWVTLMGANGSGKSTLALLVLGLLNGAEGSIRVDGLNPFDPKEVWEVRRKVGIVFQNPDTQMVSSVVEREIAFGPENYGMERSQMLDAVAGSMDRFHLTQYRKSSPHELSGGERQRVALASGTVMDGDYLLLDEPTSLLDPIGRREFLEYLQQLRTTKGILHITTFSKEALLSDRLVILHQGRIVADGKPLDIFVSDAPLWDRGVDVPLEAEIHRLNAVFPPTIYPPTGGL
jgi:energy-coupling factor transport system ATP-binding protein